MSQQPIQDDINNKKKDKDDKKSNEEKPSLDIKTFLTAQRLLYLLASFEQTGVSMKELWVLSESDIRKFCDEKLKCKMAEKEAITTAIISKEETEIVIMSKAKAIELTNAANDAKIDDETVEDNKQDEELVEKPAIKFDSEFCDEKYFEILNDGYELRGSGATCAGYTVYAQTSEIKGYNKGIHFWSIKLLGNEEVNNYCYHTVGIVPMQRNKIFLAQRSSDDWQTWQEDAENSWYSGFREPERWNRGETLTVKLNCDEGIVQYYKDGTLIKTQNINADKFYYFAISSCASKDNYFQSVNTPKNIK